MKLISNPLLAASYEPKLIASLLLNRFHFSSLSMISRTIVLNLFSCVRDLIQDPSPLLRIDRFRLNLTKQRLQESLADSSGQLKAFSQTDTSDMIENTIRHNVESLNPEIALWRPMGLMGALLSMDQVMNHMHDVKILIMDRELLGNSLYSAWVQ